MVMDVCSLPESYERDLPVEGYVVEMGDVEFPEGTVCKRQYCSEDHDEFGFSINAITFLIPTSEILKIDMNISFEWERFELRCEPF